VKTATVNVAPAKKSAPVAKKVAATKATLPAKKEVVKPTSKNTASKSPSQVAPAKADTAKAKTPESGVKPTVVQPAPKKAEAPKAEAKVVSKAETKKSAEKATKEEAVATVYKHPSPTETTAKPAIAVAPKPAAPPEPKPVANPIYVPPGPNGKPGVKFAPIAHIQKPAEKKTIQKDDTDDMASKTSPRLAFMESDDKKGITVEDKLRALYDIQLIDSRIDKIKAMRGELPLEVEDLEDEVAGLETRISNFSSDLKELEEKISNKKQGIKDAEALIKKYKEQLDKVKNNREFESLNKEIEFQDLEIQLHKKHIREFEAQATQKSETLANAEQKLKERKNDLSVKQTELDEIINETKREEEILRKKSDESKKLIEQRLIDAYERIRGGSPNGLAVVPIEREASAGSFIQLPPQKQMDVAARKKVIVDEHSGRILVDGDLAREEQEKIDALLASELGK
jgi:predicted  nucleic acid-binding Zn-ribbon protein